jgi:hypothetical protein
VSIGVESTAEETDAVSLVFESAGVGAQIERDIARPSLDTPWVLYLSASPRWVATRFSEFEADAIANAWPGLMRFVRRIAGCFPGRSGGAIIVTDPHSDVQIALSDDLPDDAYRQLLEIVLLEIPARRIGWSRDHGSWTDLSGHPIDAE